MKNIMNRIAELLQQIEYEAARIYDKRQITQGDNTDMTCYIDTSTDASHGMCLVAVIPGKNPGITYVKVGVFHRVSNDINGSELATITVRFMDESVFVNVDTSNQAKLIEDMPFETQSNVEYFIKEITNICMSLSTNNRDSHWV